VAHRRRIRSTNHQIMATRVFLLLTTLLLGPSSVQSFAGLTPPTESLGRRRFLNTAAVGGVAITAGVLGKKGIDGPAPYEPVPGSLTGQVMVITGGTAGLGLESGKRLAAGGATIVLTSRSIAKGNKAVEAVQEYLSSRGIVNDKVFCVPLDLDDLENVKTFRSRLEASPALASSNKINVLMANAGVMAIPDRQITKDGYERTFQSNHLGHFALTAELFPLLANDARVINVSSDAYMIASKGLQLENLNGETEYGPWSSYGQSKLSNILFTKELQERANKRGLALTAVALHPGAVRTDLARNLIGEDKFAAMQKDGPAGSDFVLLNALSYFTRSVENGASTQVFLAAGNGDVVKGEYYVDMQAKKVGDAALDMDKAKALWDISEKLTGVKFEL
jgi:NAD(P)-dependent dehydrogenase (short-subunit alcohol dehydrogenase family)